jgi:copper chaperone CopZ
MIKKSNKPLVKKTPKVKAVKNNEKKSINWILWIGTVSIIAPFIVLAIVLLSASGATGKPQNGPRFNGDLTYPLKNEDVTKISEALKGVPGVQEASASLKVATLQVYIDTTDTLSEEEIKTLQLDLYNKINELYPVAQYFANQGISKQYDLVINTYNSLDSGTFIYFILNKNAGAEDYFQRNYAVPLDAALAEELRTQTSGEGSGQ